MLDSAAAGAQPSEAPVTGNDAATPEAKNGADFASDRLALASKLLGGLSDDAAKEPEAKDEAGEGEKKPDRHPDGKFKAAEKSADAEKASEPANDGAKPDDKPAEAKTPAPVRSLPDHWKLATSAQEKWGATPPEVQDAIVKAAVADRQTISRQGRELKYFEPFKGVIGEQADYFKEIGVHPAQMLSHFMQWDQALKDPATRDRAVSAFMRSYGIDLSRYGASEGSAADSDLPHSPEVSALQKEIDGLKATIRELGGQTSRLTQTQEQAERQFQEAAEAREVSTLAAAITKAVDSDPDLKSLMDEDNTSYEAQEFQADFADAYRSLQRRGVPADQLIAKALDRARTANPALRERAENQRRAEEAKQREDAAKAEEAKRKADQARRASAINGVRSSPEASAPAPSLDEARAAVLRKFGMLT